MPSPRKTTNGDPIGRAISLWWAAMALVLILVLFSSVRAIHEVPASPPAAEEDDRGVLVRSCMSGIAVKRMKDGSLTWSSSPNTPISGTIAAGITPEDFCQ